MSDAIVNTADVVNGTISVKASELKKGDLVFDWFGSTYPLTRDARALKSGLVSFQREDYHTEYAEPDADFTIIRPDGE